MWENSVALRKTGMSLTSLKRRTELSHLYLIPTALNKARMIFFLIFPTHPPSKKKKITEFSRGIKIPFLFLKTLFGLKVHDQMVETIYSLGFLTLKREEISSVPITKCLHGKDYRLWEPQPGIQETPALVPHWREMFYYRGRYLWFTKTSKSQEQSVHYLRPLWVYLIELNKTEPSCPQCPSPCFVRSREASENAKGIDPNGNKAKIFFFTIWSPLGALDLVVNYGDGKRGIQVEILQGCLWNLRGKSPRRCCQPNLGLASTVWSGT